MARLVQVSGDGWVADKPVGGLGRTPILGQKQLRDETVKTCHGRQYKKDLSYAQYQQNGMEVSTRDKQEKNK